MHRKNLSMMIRIFILHNYFSETNIRYLYYNSPLALTPLNTILLSGPLLLNSFIDPDTFGKSCISFKPLNLDQKHVISK